MEQTYNIFVLETDAITIKWPLISSWYPIIFINFGYLYFIYIAGPHYMKDRPPYKLKNFIFFYNIFQILTNLWIVKEHIRGGWLTKYGFKCAERGLDSHNAEMLINVLWWLMLLKILDYIETCIFVLRKKQHQVSILHVYHHISISISVWICLRYAPDARVTFMTLLNCSVHVIMYTYYFCAACGPRIQQIVAPIKSYITIIQMIQFIVILMYLVQYLLSHQCEVSRGIQLLPYFIINIIIYLFLFYKFYRKSYTKSPKQNID